MLRLDEERKMRMDKPLTNLAKQAVGPLVGILLGASLVSVVGAHGGDAAKIHACVNSGGNIVIIGPNAACTGGLQPLDWNIQGIQGLKGDQGIQGLKGDKGDIGLTGATGPAGADSTVPGPQGLTGPAGATGPAGPKGDQGVQGLQGDQGVQGPQGIQGPPGLSGLELVTIANIQLSGSRRIRRLSTARLGRTS